MIGNFLIKLFSTMVGIDRIGNKYYLSFSRDHGGKRIRQVIYNGFDEATKIPTEWYSWMHGLSDNIPEQDIPKAIWSKERIINRTGSEDAYSPDNACLKQEYNSWQPNKN